MLEYTKEVRGNAAVFTLTGPLGLEETAQLRKIFWHCINEERLGKLILDLKRVPLLDCSAVSLFVATKNVVAKRRGQLILVGSLKDFFLFERTHLDHYFDIRASVAEAMSDN